MYMYFNVIGLEYGLSRSSEQLLQVSMFGASVGGESVGGGSPV